MSEADNIPINFPIRFDGFEDEWDADNAEASIEVALRKIGLYLSSVADGNINLRQNGVGTVHIRDRSITRDKLSITGGFSWPDHDVYKTLHITDPVLDIAEFGKSLDPRIRRVAGVVGDGMVPGEGFQRFRIRSLDLTGWKIALDRATSSDNSYHNAFAQYWGAIVIGIPHNLGRIPSGMLWQGGARGEGSGGDVKVVHNHDTSWDSASYPIYYPMTGNGAGAGQNAEFSPWGHGDEWPEAAIRFLPILGETKDEIEQLVNRLEHSGSHSSTTGNTNVSSLYDALPEWVYDSMVTTETHFSGFAYLARSGDTVNYSGQGSKTDGPPNHTESTPAAGVIGRPPVLLSSANEPWTSFGVSYESGPTNWGLVRVTWNNINHKRTVLLANRAKIGSGHLDFIMG